MKTSDNVIHLQTDPRGIGALRTPLREGRFEVVTAGPNPEFGFIKSDPYGTNVGTGLVVPSTPSAALGDARYMMMLARASFQSGERGVRLVGIRLYADLVARIAAGSAPLAASSGPATGSTVVFRREIRQPLWHPPDGNISLHVMVLDKRQIDTRNPANADGVIFRMSKSPALLYETIAGPPTAPTAYTPPHGGVPWGKAIKASLGNIHELRYLSRTDRAEDVLDVPVPVPCDVALFASVRQNDPATNPSLADPAVTQQFAALSHEDQFLVAYHQFAQYGVISGGLTFDRNLGEGSP